MILDANDEERALKKLKKAMPGAAWHNERKVEDHGFD